LSSYKEDNSFAMARILVIQPHKMLQQAIVVALFPDYHVQVSEKIPEAEPAAEVDLVIIDYAALREANSSAASEIRALESWRLPVVLIGAGAVGDKTLSRNCRRLNTPVHRDELRRAVTESLGSSVQPRSSSAAATSSAPAVPVKKKISAGSFDNRKEVIELTDVIEEAPAYDNSEMEASSKA
jgi:hypothetical protein